MPPAPRPFPKRPVLLVLAGAGLAILAIAVWLGARPADRPPVLASVQSGTTIPSPPQAPAVAAPVMAPVAAAPALVARPPSFDIVRVSPQGDAVIAGRAAPGANVTITDNGQEIGRAKATPEGQFVIIPDHPLAAGGRELALNAQTPDGRVATAEAPLVVVVPARPSANGPVASTPPAALALLTPPVGPPRLLQAPAAPDEASRAARFGLDVIDYGEHGAIHFAGNAPAGGTVRIYVDDKPLGDAIADATRRWVLSPLADLAPGSHRVRVDLLGPGNKVASRVELPFERATAALAQVAGERVVVQPRANLWRIARQAYGQGTRYTVIYEANRDQIRNPDRIYPGQVFSVPKDAARAAR